MNELVLSENYGILQIASSKKCGKYKIIDAITTEFDGYLYLSGIVDSSNMEVFPFTPDATIKFLGNNHFFVKTPLMVFHYQFNLQGIPVLKNSFEKYEQIDNECYKVEKDGKYSVYNINKEPTTYYTSLSAFHLSKKYNKKIASFFETIYIEEQSIELTGMIDMEDNFTNNCIYNITDDEFVKICSKEEYIEYCNKLSKKKEKKQSIKKLFKKYIPHVKK